MKRLLKLLLLVLSIVYPFLVYFGLQHGSEKLLLVLLFVLLGLRWCSVDNSAKSLLNNSKIVFLIPLGLLFIIWLFGESVGLKAYPVMVSVTLLVTFFTSLCSSMPIVERLARLKEKTLSPTAIIYTRKVTWMWSGFFLFNALAAAYTGLWSSNEIWLFYNGFLSYILIACLAGGEWLVRIKVKRDQPNSHDE